MNISRIIESYLEKLTEKIGLLLKLCLLLVMFIAVYEVIMRYVFNRPTIWAWEVNQQILVLIVALGGSYTLSKGEFVRVDIFYSAYKPKVKAIVEMISSIFIFFYCGLLLWEGWVMFFRSFKVREVGTTLLKPPIYPAKFLIPLGAFLVILQGLKIFFKNFWQFARTKKDF